MREPRLYDESCQAHGGGVESWCLDENGICGECRREKPCSVCGQYAPHECQDCGERVCAKHAVIGPASVRCRECHLAYLRDEIADGAAELQEEDEFEERRRVA